MRDAFLVLIACLFLSEACIADGLPPGKKIVKTKDGVIVYPDLRLSGNTAAVRVQVIGADIFRVTAWPTLDLTERKSLITTFTPSSTKWSLVEKPGVAMIKTGFLTASILLSTGAVSFLTDDGKEILKERAFNGRKFSPAVFEGEHTYDISQIFEISADDAYYGLGQHQDDVFNYRGRQVKFFQNNTEVTVPFLVSNKNYGILWDNYSLGEAGDLRPYRQLNDLKLFSKDGSEGWLTASYYNDKGKRDQKILERAESSINMEFLGESKMQLPAEFTPATGSVVWEGSIASDLEGKHSFRLIYGGYIKIWFDGKLVIDRWRKAWNPAPANIDLPMEKDKKVAIKIEWIPEGAESYLALKWLPPIEPANRNSFGFHAEAGQMEDYYFIKGINLDGVIYGYRSLTGRANIVPHWAMGFWQSRERYKTQAEILATVDEFRRRKIPLDNIVLDWSYWKEAEWGSQDFDPARFSNVDSMLKVLHDKYHTQLMISVWPKFYEGITTYNDFDKKGWLYRRNIADRQRDWIGKGYTSTFYDAFNSDARKGFWDLINKKIYSKGVDAWWMDASEPDILSNVSPQKRKLQMSPTALGTAAEYLNAYPLQNAKGIYEGQRRTDPNKRVFLLTRSGFAGSQRYSAAIWSGDIGARWQDLKAQIPAGINFSMSGIPYWTMDIGGFVVENRFEKPNAQDLEEWRELQTRWFQFGAFVPLFRVHGQFPFREVFNIAPEDHPAYKSMLYYNKLRYRLMPYIYSLAGMTFYADYTIMRGLVMDFSRDSAVINIGDQFMFGPSLLVNPVYNYRAETRELYLPAGQGWYDLYSGKYFSGGRKIEADAPYERMPVFVKEGSILPFGPDLQYAAEKTADTISLFVYTGKDGRFVLYEDEGTNYNYEKGALANIPIEWNEALKQLTIGVRLGTFPGILNKRVFRIKWITPSKPRGLDWDENSDKEVPYAGSAVTVKM